MNFTLETDGEDEVMIENASGIVPVEFKVLVQLQKTEKVTGGGIIIPDTVHEKEQMATTKATLVAVGGNAFEDWRGDLPQVGDSVLISKYAGQVHHCGDGLEYRLCNDKDIAAILR